MSIQQPVPKISLAELRHEIQKEYSNVALDPEKGYHFHTGRRLAVLLGYDESLYAGLPESVIASFAGTGNPFSVGLILPGETVVDIGSGAGFDSLIASRLVGPAGRVISWSSARCPPTRWSSAPKVSASAPASLPETNP